MGNFTPLNHTTIITKSKVFVVQKFFYKKILSIYLKFLINFTSLPFIFKYHELTYFKVPAQKLELTLCSGQVAKSFTESSTT